MTQTLIVTLCAVLFALGAEGTGAFVRKLLKSDADGFAGPLGMAVLFCVLEILYIPSLVFHASIRYGGIVTLIVAAASLCMCYFLKEQKGKIHWIDVIGTAGTIVLFLLIQRQLHIVYDGEEFREIVSSASMARVDLGRYGLQGYDLLASVLVRWADPDFMVGFLSIVYHLFFAEMSMNIIRLFHLRNKWFAFTLSCYALYMAAFNSWQIAESYAGYIWRPMMISLMMYQTFCWLKGKNEWEKYELMFYEGAGMFVSGGFGMIMMELLYCLAAWLFYKKKIRSLFDMTTLVAPWVIYGSMQLMRIRAWIGFLLPGVYFVFLVVRYRKKPRRVLRRAEDYMLEHAVKIMYIIIPSAVLVLNVLLLFVKKDVLVSLSAYKLYFQEEPLRSFFFMDGSYVSYLLDFFRWGGLIILMFTAKDDNEKQLRSMYLLFLILFVNPLSMGLMARMSSISVYAYSFEVLFNPFTDLCLFIMIYRMFAWQPLGQWVLEFALLFSAVFSHVGSFAGRPSGLYTDLVQQARIIETNTEK